MEIDAAALAAAFGGGLFGAAVGALPAFIFTGLLVLAGVAAAASGGGTDILTHAAFGPVFGPHISFGGGVAATAYAYKRRLLETGRDISIPLMGLNRTDVLLVGGAFGLIGYLLNALWQAVGLGPKTDTIALTVVVSAMIARLAFGNSTLIGKSFTPNEAFHWVRHQERPAQAAAIGIGVGLLSAYMAGVLGVERGGGVLGFGIAAATLVFAQFGLKAPVTHHIALPAATAAIASGNLYVGALFGIGGAFAAEAFSRIVHMHGDTHVDPPAAGIAAATLLARLIWPL